MNSVFKLTILLTISMASACNSGDNAPEAEKIEKEFTEFGNTRTDNYYWMNDRKNPKVMSYLKAENDYFDRTFLKKKKKLTDKIFKEMKDRVKEADSTAPYYENGYWYYIKYEKDKDYEIYCRKKILIPQKKRFSWMSIS